MLPAMISLGLLALMGLRRHSGRVTGLTCSPERMEVQLHTRA